MLKRDLSRSNVDDMIMLENISEEGILKNLKNRYAQNSIYTFIGEVLISVNPFKQIPNLYSDGNIQQYQSHYAFELPPHVFSIAEDAYRNLLIDKRNQCIIITGESGAGKTEASKQLMSFIAAASGKGGIKKTQKGAKTSKKGTDHVVKEQILQSNPVLEAFGNAKTIRNNNSSRFGKYMEIQFDHVGNIIGGEIMDFLLEKSRVIRQAQNERNFHIFYQILSDKKLKDGFGLSNAQDYTYLNQNGCYTVKDINDSNDFNQTLAAMESIGINKKEQLDLFAALGGILELGNVEFEEKKGQASVKSKKALATASKLFKVDMTLLENCLVTKLVEAGGRSSQYYSPLTISEAEQTRDALAKGIYGKLFTWLISRINMGIKSSVKIVEDSKSNPAVIGILDIYGFEIFENNSFEQLCINYVNERLQQVFIELTLKEEQEEYVREGIIWEPIQYVNNKKCVDLIDGKMGIFDMLNESCLMKGDDKQFLEKMKQNIKKNEFMIWGDLKESKQLLNQETFTVKHYAGMVSYDVNKFTSKNMDTFFQGLNLLMEMSENQILKNAFSDGSSQKTGPSLGRGASSGVRGNQAAKRPPPLATQFKKQVELLMKKIYSCRPHYIRCIKPNEKKIPNSIDDTNVSHQIQYLGLLENVKVKRAGFAYRQKIETFLHHYRILIPEMYPNFSIPLRDGCEKIINMILEKNTAMTLSNNKKAYQIGKTKVFLRSPEVVFSLEECRERRLMDIASVIQRTYRRYKARKYYIEIKKKAQNIFEGHKLRRRISINRTFIGDYLGLGNNKTVLKYMKKFGDEKVLFSNYVTKMNHKHKSQKRVLMLTEKNIYNWGSSHKSPKFKRKMEIISLKGITLSPYTDNYFILHWPSPYDHIFESDDKTEIVSILKETYASLALSKSPSGAISRASSLANDGKSPLSVSFSQRFTYKCSKKDSRTMTFISSKDLKAVSFKPSGKIDVSVFVPHEEPLSPKRKLLQRNKSK